MMQTPREYAEDMECPEGRCPDCGGQVLAEGEGPGGTAGMCTGCDALALVRMAREQNWIVAVEPPRVDQVSRDADEAIEALVREIERLWWPDAESPVCTIAGVRRVELRYSNGQWYAHDHACARSRGKGDSETLTVGVIKIEVPLGYGDESLEGER